MAWAIALALGVFAIAYVLQWPSFSSQASLSLRLKLAALAGLAPAAVLLLCIARLAKHRFTTPQDIHGSALTEGTERAKLLQALLQNTLEQTFRQDSFRWLPPLPRSLLLDVSSSFVAMPAAHLLAQPGSA